MHAEDELIVYRELKRANIDKAIEIIQKAISETDAYIDRVVPIYGRLLGIQLLTSLSTITDIFPGNQGYKITIRNDRYISATGDRAKKAAEILANHLREQYKSEGIRANVRCTPGYVAKPPYGNKQTQIECLAEMKIPSIRKVIEEHEKFEMRMSLAMHAVHKWLYKHT